MNSQTVTTPIQNSLSSYFNYLRTIPRLTAEQEHELAVQYRDTGDLEIARTLVTSNLRFVVFIAKLYRKYGFPFEDIIQEGNVGLMKAVKKFDPDVGTTIVNFAVYYIKNEIHNYIIKNYKILKIATTKPQIKLFFNLKKYKNEFNFITESEAEKISKELNVSKKDIYEMENRFNSNDISLDVTADDSPDDISVSPLKYLQQANGDPAEILENSNFEQYNQKKLNVALMKLDTRSRDIIKSRWLDTDNCSLQELADKYNVSFQRIGQIEKDAIKKLKLSFV